MTLRIPAGVLYSSLITLLLSGLLFGSCSPKEETAEGQLSVLQVPDGYIIEDAVSPGLIAYPMFASFDDRGRLFVFESTGVNTMGTEKMLAEPTYRIRLLEDADGDGRFDKSSVYVDSVPLPMGGSFYQGSLYAAAPPHLMRYTDTDDDGVADKKEVILSGWKLHANAATLHGPFIGPDGWLYLCDARRGFEITSKEGETLKGKSARIWRCRPDGSGLESLAGGGFDNTIEMIFMPGGETIGTMTYFTDPQDGQRDALMHWVEGGVYPKYGSVIDDDQLKLTGGLMPVMTKLPRIAHSGLMRYRGKALGEDMDGNLFSAVFNTGKVTRHIIEPDGATFRTREEDFMTSRSSDTHPTDVLQDADGSLLVVITGGWFIEGCPLSRVAKPDVQGGIYRIRRKNAPQVEDPWGHQLKLREQSPETLSGYLNEPRFAVRDQAIERLVSAGGQAVPSLIRLLESEEEETRTAAVFALGRIQTDASLAAVRSALNDNSAVVRTAAARSLGLARDTAAVDRLMELVKQGDAPVRRQAAAALGQIGDIRSVPALLQGAGNQADRFVEHAIIHSLITLGQPALLAAALNNSSAGVRKAAVVALDQMDRSPLRQEQLLPFLLSKESDLRQTGIWIASRRQEWGGMVIEFLEKGLPESALPEDERAAIVRLMISFNENQQLQTYVARQLGDPQTPVSRKLLLLDVIAGSTLKELPASWTRQLGDLLLSGDETIRTGVLQLIESRSIPALNNDIAQIIGNTSASPDFRIQALRARSMTDPQLAVSEFRLLMDYLKPGVESPVRQSAARLLARAKLSEAQLLEIADQQVASADLYLLPSLIAVFHGDSSAAVGSALVRALSDSPDRLETLSEQDMEKLLSGFPADVQESAKPLMAALREKHAERLGKLEALEKSLGRGDLDRGRAVFFGKGVCFTCHTVGREGVQFGPDLSNIGEIRSRHDILEAIVYPSASFAREYDTYEIKTAGKSYLGVIKDQLSDAVILAAGPGADIRVPKSEITSMEPHPVSMMPPGLEGNLSIDELSDLMAYLKSLPDSYKTLK